MKGGGGIGSGPEAAVKGFYEAVDKGDMSEVEKHLGPAKNIANDFGNPAWGCGYEDLKGRIEKVEILRKEAQGKSAMVEVKVRWQEDPDDPCGRGEVRQWGLNQYGDGTWRIAVSYSGHKLIE